MDDYCKLVSDRQLSVKSAGFTPQLTQSLLKVMHKVGVSPRNHNKWVESRN